MIRAHYRFKNPTKYYELKSLSHPCYTVKQSRPRTLLINILKHNLAKHFSKK